MYVGLVHKLADLGQHRLARKTNVSEVIALLPFTSSEDAAVQNLKPIPYASSWSKTSVLFFFVYISVFVRERVFPRVRNQLIFSLTGWFS